MKPGNKFSRVGILLALFLGLALFSPQAPGPQAARADAAGFFQAISDIFTTGFGSIGALRIAKSERHLNSCKHFCNKDKRCVKCSRKPNCGKGYKKLKGWTGYGKNWYACAAASNRDAASRINNEACHSWCRLTPGCVKCSRKPGCGIGYKKLKGWTGWGNNWYACKKR